MYWVTALNVTRIWIELANGQHGTILPFRVTFNAVTWYF